MLKISQSLRDVTAYTLFSTTASALAPFQYGFHLAELNAPQDLIICGPISMMNGVAPQKIFKFSNCIRMSEAQFAFLSSIFFVGGFIGAISAGPGSSSYGRLQAMKLSSLFFIFGSVLETIAESVSIMSVGRFLLGIGSGAATVIAPLYISEISPPKTRGMFGTMTQVMICLGILSTQIMGFIFNNNMQWRFILATGIGVGIIHAITLFFIPESPAWLAVNRDPQLAKEILQSIRNVDYEPHKEILSWNVLESNLNEEDPSLEPLTSSSPIQDESESPRIRYSLSPKLRKKGFFGVISDPQYRPAVIAVVGMMFAQQFSGINSINLYSVSLLRGILPISSLVLTIIISSLNVVVTILCAPLVEHFGRKSCLLVSTIGMGLMSFILALSLVLGLKPLSALSVLFFVGFFAIGLGPVPFMMASELVGQEAVSATQSWCLAGNYISTLLVAQFFPLVNTWLNTTFGGFGWVYFGFAALAIIDAIFIACRVPETKGKNGPHEVWGRIIPDEAYNQDS